jgi:hypothetical protein
MRVPDLINACFEASGALAQALNVRQLLRDKLIRGFHIGPTIFFTSWGIWNLYFYPAVGQWYSFVGGATLCATNALYVALTLHYLKKEKSC